MDIHNRLIGPDGQPLQSSQENSPLNEQPEHAEQPELDFFNYVASLSFQAMIFLGEVPNPITNKNEKNLKQAKFLIDTLALIKEKTIGNLTKEENELMDGSLYELQRRFVEIAQKEPNA